MEKNDVLRVVLDEPQLFVEEAVGSAMVRGEVIVNFPTDMQVQGPIKVLFEGIQRLKADIAKRYSSTTSPIETKVYTKELPLLPSISKGIIPAGVQRFPFEFPIPASLPITVNVRDRYRILYQVTLTLRLSSSSSDQQQSSAMSLINWALGNDNRPKYVASSPIRIIHALESSISRRLTSLNGGSANPPSRVRITPNGEEPLYEELITNATSAAATSALSQALWESHVLDTQRGTGTLDEQHDQLAPSMSGKTSSNLNQPIDKLNDTEGIRFKIGIDRTAIAIGTSVGVELMIEPTIADAVVKSVAVKLNEHRRYTLKIPSSSFLPGVYNTDRFDEKELLVLKWGKDSHGEDKDSNTARPMGKKRGKYVHKRSSSSQYFAYFHPPQPGHPNYKLPIDNNTDSGSVIDSSNEEDSLEKDDDCSCGDCNEVMNLQKLDQPVKLGEYFFGRFKMEVPECYDVLHPSMEHEFITITHWQQLVVGIECNGKTFYIKMDAPCRMLHCRLVLPDDEGQTIMPPPPSYDHNDAYNTQDQSKSSFWKQREAITSNSGWGLNILCPCETKRKVRKARLKGKSSTTSGEGCTRNNAKSTSILTDLAPELLPPPAYEC